jgi:hypothetical protein
MAIADMTPDAREELAWLEGLLDRGYSGPGHVVREILPSDYPAYVRILHPFVNMAAWVDMSAAEMPIEDFRTWASMAAQIGLELHGETTHHTLAKADVSTGSRKWMTETGRLRHQVQRALSEILSEISGSSPIYFGYTTAAYVAGWRSPIVTSVPFVELEDLQRIMDDEAGMRDGPEYWWSKEHAWVVCSDFDLTSTYVACAEDVAEVIIAHPDIEALYVSPDMRIDSAADGT